MIMIALETPQLRKLHRRIQAATVDAATLSWLSRLLLPVITTSVRQGGLAVRLWPRMRSRKVRDVTAELRMLAGSPVILVTFSMTASSALSSASEKSRLRISSASRGCQL